MYDTKKNYATWFTGKMKPNMCGNMHGRRTLQHGPLQEAHACEVSATVLPACSVKASASMLKQ